MTLHRTLVFTIVLFALTRAVGEHGGSAVGN